LKHSKTVCTAQLFFSFCLFLLGFPYVFIEGIDLIILGYFFSLVFPSALLSTPHFTKSIHWMKKVSLRSRFSFFVPF